MPRELIKSRPKQFDMRYTCQVCERQTQTTLGYNYDSDEEARKHASTHIVNGWWVADDQVVCGLCLRKARDGLGSHKAKGFIKPIRREAQYAIKHERDFALQELAEIEALRETFKDEAPPPPRTMEAAYLKDMKKREKRLRVKVGKK